MRDQGTKRATDNRNGPSTPPQLLRVISVPTRAMSTPLSLGAGAAAVHWSATFVTLERHVCHTAPLFAELGW